MGAWSLTLSPYVHDGGVQGMFIHFMDIPRSLFPPQDRAICQEEQVRLSMVTSTMSHLQTFIEYLLWACLVLSIWESTVKEEQSLWLSASLL